MLTRSGRVYGRLRLLRNRAVISVKRLRWVHPTSSIHPTTRTSSDLVAAPYVFVGRNCDIAPQVEIGKYTMLAPRVAIVGGDHEWGEVGVPMQFGGRSAQLRTCVGADVWIGFGTTILRETTIGRGSIVAAGAVVTTDVPPYEVWGGVPARRIRDRFDSVAKRTEHDEMLDGQILRPRFAERLR